MQHSHTIEMRKCGDCGVEPGQQHHGGCDVERCVLCGGQLIGCDCVYGINGIKDLEVERPDIYHNGPTEEMYEKYDARVAEVGGPLLWTGIWPGVEEAIEFGWFSRWINCETGEPCEFNTDVPGKWQECKKDDVGAGPDLNRIGAHHLVWSINKRRWTKP